MSKYKAPCGMRDFSAKDVKIRRYIFDKVRKLFELRGGDEIETPVAELMTTVEGIYGEEFNKLVYKTGENSTEPLILRYDLTVPLARYVNSNGLSVFRRFHIGKVYRKDHPQADKGRFREFYQCDFDIIGTDNNLMIYDTEILELLSDCLNTFLGNNFKILINHRQIVYKILEMTGIAEEKYNEVCSTLDKMDKKPWTEIIVELTDVRKLSEESIKILTDIKNNISEFNGPNIELLKYMKSLEYIREDTYKEILMLFENFELLNIETNFMLNPFLIRGLDYYTGVIYEAIFNDSTIMPSSIASGGRYDKMLGKIGTRGDIPAIGMSLGIERLVVILEKIYPNIGSNFIKHPIVYVTSVGKNMMQSRIILCSELRKNGVFATMPNKENPKMDYNFKQVFNNDIAYMAILGENEVKNNNVTLKNIKNKEECTLGRDEFIQLMVKISQAD